MFIPGVWFLWSKKEYFWPLAHVSGPTSNKLVVVVVVVVLVVLVVLVGNVHTFKYGVIWKQL